LLRSLDVAAAASLAPSVLVLLPAQ